MCRICLQVFLKFDHFVTMSQMGVAYSALKTFRAFLTFPQLCLPYPFLKFLESKKKNYNFFRIKDNLAVLP